MGRKISTDFVEAVAKQLHNGLEFYRAFDEVFNRSNFLVSDRKGVMKEVASSLGNRSAVKRRNQIIRQSVTIKPIIQKPHTAESGLLFDIHPYPD